MYAPRPTFLGLLPPFGQEQTLQEEQRDNTDNGQSPEGRAVAEAEELGRNLSSSLLHLVVLQVMCVTLLWSGISGNDINNGVVLLLAIPPEMETMYNRIFSCIILG